MKYGLKDEIYDKILNIARKNKQYKFILFGSRARGKYKKESDIDIAIKGNIKTEDKYRIINEFDLINTIHKIDLVFIEELTKKELVENIDKIWRKKTRPIKCNRKTKRSTTRRKWYSNRLCIT